MIKIARICLCSVRGLTLVSFLYHLFHTVAVVTTEKTLYVAELVMNYFCPDYPQVYGEKRLNDDFRQEVCSFVF